MLRMNTAVVSVVMSMSSNNPSLYINRDLLVKGPFPMIRLVILNAALAAFTNFQTQRNNLENSKQMDMI